MAMEGEERDGKARGKISEKSTRGEWKYMVRKELQREKIRRKARNQGVGI